MKSIVAVGMCTVLLAAAVLGCGRPQMSENPVTGTSNEPEWVAHGGNAFPDEKGEAIFGVAVAEKQYAPSKYLRQKAAKERARLDLAAQIRTLVQGVFKDYADAAFTESSKEAAQRSLTSVVQKSIVDEALWNSRVEDVWHDEKTGDYWALVKVGMDGVATKIRNKMLELERDRLSVDAAEAHEELDEIIEKYRTGD